MLTPLKITFYCLIILVHVYTVYHIHYNAGFMEETILAFTVGFMNSSEYQTYLNYLFDVFYCTLIALYFVSRWSSKEVEGAADGAASGLALAAPDPESPEKPTTVQRVTEQQPQKQQHQSQNSSSPRNKTKRGSNAKTNHKNNKNWAEKAASTSNRPSSIEEPSSSIGDRTQGARSKNSITLENGAICGVTGTATGGDLRFSFASLTFFDVLCISFVFPLCLLAIYLGWNLQTSVEVSWLSWRWLWGWWTERWTWWRLAGCLVAVVGITVWIKPRKIQGKSD